MAIVIGKINNVDGEFFAKTNGGSLRKLSLGDEIFQGEIVVGNKSNNDIDNLVIGLEDGSEVALFGQDTQLFDASVVQQVEFSHTDTVSKQSSINTILEENGEEINLDEIETAAGEEGGTSSTEGGETDFEIHESTASEISANINNETALETKADSDDEEDIAVEGEMARIAEDFNNIVNTIDTDTDSADDSSDDEDNENMDTDVDTDIDSEDDSSDNEDNENMDTDVDTDIDSEDDSSDDEDENHNHDDKEHGNKGDNGYGNGDEDAPGNSEDHNNAENGNPDRFEDDELNLENLFDDHDKEEKQNHDNHIKGKDSLSIEDLFSTNDEGLSDNLDGIGINSHNEKESCEDFSEYASNEDPTVVVKVDNDINMDGF